MRRADFYRCASKGARDGATEVQLQNDGDVDLHLNRPLGPVLNDTTVIPPYPYCLGDSPDGTDLVTSSSVPSLATARRVNSAICTTLKLSQIFALTRHAP